MAEAGLYIGWGEPTRGREKAALNEFNDSMQYYGRLQQDGKIERFDVVVLMPGGSEAGGFIMVRGTAQQIDALRRDDEFLDRLNRVQLIVDGLRVSDAWVDDSLVQQMTRYDKAVTQFA
jgi:hypothetical protein